jgi:hypothetical protein
MSSVQYDGVTAPKKMRISGIDAYGMDGVLVSPTCARSARNVQKRMSSKDASQGWLVATDCWESILLPFSFPPPSS